MLVTDQASSFSGLSPSLTGGHRPGPVAMGPPLPAVGSRRPERKGRRIDVVV